MYTNQRQNNDTKELRRLGGRWLKEKRESSGLSQRQLAEILGVEYYTFISQIETGHGRIPPDRYEAWAGAIKVDLSDFVREILRYYDPVTFSILFGAGGTVAVNGLTGAPEPGAHDRDALVAENRQLQEQVRELQRLLGKKTMELEQMRENLAGSISAAPRPSSGQRAVASHNGTTVKGTAAKATAAKGTADKGTADKGMAANRGNAIDVTATLDGVSSYRDTGD